MAGRFYGYADVGRFGLGHGLLAWARCVVWCHDSGAEVIAPRWLRLRIGPYLRRERDKRSYFRLFHAGSQVAGLRRARLLALADRRAAETDRPKTGDVPTRDTVVVFENAWSGNEAKFFHEIDGRSGLVRAALLDMTRPRFIPPRIAESHIAVHVRGGDFQTPSDISALKSGRHNLRIPISWYVEMLVGLRRRLGYAPPAIIYSDCSDEELTPLLSLESVRRSTTAEAVTDMLAMGEARALISSGSGFSRWGSYLGQTPRLCFPGQRVIRTLGGIRNGPDLEPECEMESEIPEAFVDHVRAGLAQGAVG